jgi:hypothetical protein
MATATMKRKHEGTVGTEEYGRDNHDRFGKCAKTAVELIARSCHFYKLPREPRDNIYHCLWKATPLIERHS